MGKAILAFIAANLVMVVIVITIFGLIGMLCWPYTVNTWVGAYGGEDAKTIGKGWGFLMGICPVIGQLTIPAVVVTGICDLIFIPD